MNKKTQKEAPVEGMVDATDFVELKRDMQSAKVIAWLQYNQQQLIAGAVVVIVALLGSAVWQAQQKAQKEAAALLYIQAVNTTDKSKQATLFESVINDFDGTGYATLAKLHMVSSSDVEGKKAILQSLIESEGAPEFAWQARLDLAELYLEQGLVDDAKSVLSSRVGSEYEQARYAMLAKIATDTSEKVTLIQKALDAPSHDKDLTAELEAQLALLKATQ